MRIRTIVLAALTLLALASCKKEEVDKVFMDGDLKISGTMPKFVTAGEKYTFSASGVTAPDGTGVGYYFTDPVSKKSDTTAVYTYTVPADTLGTFGLTCTAYPKQSEDKYYTTPTTINFTIVSDDRVNGSLQGISHPMSGGIATLYGRTYDTITAGGVEWIAFNLCHVQSGTVGRPYSDCPAMQNLMGGYYTWEEAVSVCPEGWRLPSDSDWVALLKECGAPEGLVPFADSPVGAGKLMTRATLNGEPVWDYFRNVIINPTLGFNAISAGYANLASGAAEFKGFGSYAAFWTSDEIDGEGIYRYINEAYDNVYVASASKNEFAASVRCVR